MAGIGNQITSFTQLAIGTYGYVIAVDLSANLIAIPTQITKPKIAISSAAILNLVANTNTRVKLIGGSGAFNPSFKVKVELYSQSAKSFSQES